MANPKSGVLAADTPKIYDNASAQLLRTTDVVVFIGILSTET